MKKVDSNRDRIINDITLFLILFLSAGFTVTNDIMPNTLTRILWGVVALLIVMGTKRFDRKLVIITASICLIIAVNTLLNDASLKIAVFYCIGFAVAFLYANKVRYDVFADSYVRIMTFLCVISLILWAFFWVVPSSRNWFVVENAKGNLYNDLWLFSTAVNYQGMPRNQGMFWEPGAFQTFITMALLIEINKEEMSLKRIVVFILSIVTTFSTTGYFIIFAVTVYILYVLMQKNKKSPNKQDKMRIAFIIAGVVVVLLLLWQTLFDTSTYSVFGKIINFFKSGGYGEKVSSVSIRIDSVIRPIGVFFKYPIFGCGHENLRDILYDYTNGMNTCTFVNWFAVYGVFFGVIMSCGTYKLIRKITQSKLSIFICLCIFLLSIISEDYTNSPIIMLFILEGFRRNEEVVPQNGSKKDEEVLSQNCSDK
ncbi:MAG: hypothetical protein IJ011_03850 [Clostridia bacterium]|nr:hypothetical protein [Clostridia bacterium]